MATTRPIEVDVEGLPEIRELINELVAERDSYRDLARSFGKAVGLSPRAVDALADTQKNNS